MKEQSEDLTRRLSSFETLTLEEYEKLRIASEAHAPVYLERWLQDRASASDMRVRLVFDELSDRENRRSMTMLSVYSGTLLAIAGMAVVAYGISVGANLLGLAACLAPISGLAGVFLWGYRPESKQRDQQRIDGPSDDIHRRLN